MIFASTVAEVLGKCLFVGGLVIATKEDFAFLLSGRWILYLTGELESDRSSLSDEISFG